MREVVADDALLLVAILPAARTGAVADAEPAWALSVGFVFSLVEVVVGGVG